MTPLEKAAKEVLKHGCFSKEASEITGFCRCHLLEMSRSNDKRVSTVVIGREVFFDKEFLQRIKKGCRPGGNKQNKKHRRLND